jgi:hypothetical protein
MPPKFQITTSLYNYKAFLPLLADKGRKLFGPQFRILPADLPVIIPVLGWFLHDEDVAAQFNIDLKKGIFLSGPVGCGKSRIMELMTWIQADDNAREFHFCNTDSLSTTYSRDGPSMLPKYTQTSEAFCFDDLGAESLAFHYGNSCEVMKKILLARHELFCRHGTITHITSRLPISDIEARYGSEIRSRMREMFNHCPFPADTRDKRQ